MPTLATEALPEVGATGVRFEGDVLYVTLTDCREIRLPLDRFEWLHWLLRATPEERADWSLEPRGFAVYWEELDDGIEVCHLLASQPLSRPSTRSRRDHDPVPRSRPRKAAAAR